MAAFFLFRAAVLLFQTFLQNRTAHQAGALIARRLLAGYLRLPYAFHLGRNSDESIRNAYQSSGEIVTCVLIPVVMLFSEALVVLAMLIVLLVSAPIPALLAIGVLAPLLLVMLKLVQPRLARAGNATQIAYEESLQSIQQSLARVREIKVLGREQYFVEHFGRSRMELARAWYMRAALTEVPRIAIETALMLLIVAFLGVTAIAGTSAAETLSVLGLFGYAALRVMPGLNRVLAQLNNLKYGGAASQNVIDASTC